MLSVLFFTTPVQALDPAQKKLLQSGVYQFDVEVGEAEVACSNSTPLTGNSNSAKAYNFLIGKGFTSAQASGIVGNLVAESGVFPKRKQSTPETYLATVADIEESIKAGGTYGVGIAQWTSAGRQQAWLNFAKEKGADPLDLGLELEFLLHELETDTKNTLGEIQKSKDIRQATWIFLVFFERPAATSGYEYNSTQPPAGTSAAGALNERTVLAEGVTKGSENDSSTAAPADASIGCGSLGGSLVDDESEPDFNKKYNVTYNGPPEGPFNPDDCTKGHTPGAASLIGVLMDKYSPPVTSIGGWDCRQNTNDETISIHGVGRAMDIMIDGTTPVGLETGNRIRNLLINNSEAIGIQLVIWDRHIWSVNEKGWRVYTGPSPHTDHLHIEINEEASKNAQLGQ